MQVAHFMTDVTTGNKELAETSNSFCISDVVEQDFLSMDMQDYKLYFSCFAFCS